MITFRAAIIAALADELEADPDVFLFGEDIGAAGGVFKTTEGLFERFGADRVIDTPISELAMTGAAFGSALMGRRPVLEIMFGDFMALSMDSLINQSAKWRYLSNDRVRVPLTVRTAVGAGGRFGAIHSQNPGTWMQNVAGLSLAAPSSPSDAYGLLRAAIRSDDPVVFLEHKRLFSVQGPEPDRAAAARLGEASVVRAGDDVTIVSIMKGVHDALAAADALVADGIGAEVLDLRSLRPLDLPAVLRSVAKTTRLVCVEEGPVTGGWAAGLVGQVAAEGLDLLDDVAIVCAPDHPVPFSPTLEDAWLPGADRIAAEVRARLEAGPVGAR
jgi:acetoin:2,6-dichlorophenolindophenol oxidoreductase subunit beta